MCIYALYMNILFLRFFSLTGYYKILTVVPCSQLVLAGYLFYIYAVVVKSCPTLCHPMDCSPSGSSVHGISRQEYWSGLPFPSPNFYIQLCISFCMYIMYIMYTLNVHVNVHVNDTCKSCIIIYTYNNVYVNPKLLIYPSSHFPL